MKTYNFKAGRNFLNDSEVEEKSTPEEYEMQNIEPESRENGLPLTKLEMDMLNDSALIACVLENNSPFDMSSAGNLSVEEDNRLVDARDTDGLLNIIDERKSGNDKLLDRFVPNVPFSSCRQVTKKVRFVNERIGSQKPNYKHFTNENEIQLHKFHSSSSKAELPDDSSLGKILAPDNHRYNSGDQVSNFPVNDQTGLQSGIPATEIADPENRATVLQNIPVRSLRNEIRKSPVNRAPNGVKNRLATNPPEALDQSNKFGKNVGIVFIVTTYIFLIILLGISLHTWMVCLNERKSHCVREEAYAIFVIGMLSVCLLLFYPVIAVCFVFY